MDRAQDGLALIRQLPQESDDVPRVLTIEIRGGFIQVESASEFHTDRHPLPCLTSEIRYQGVSERLEFEHINVLLGFSDLVGLV